MAVAKDNLHIQVEETKDSRSVLIEFINPVVEDDVEVVEAF